MTDLDRLNAAILANPADDAVRLVYADKLQDLDTEESRARAEFIRVQVAIARHNPKDSNQGLCRTAGYGPCAACRELDALRERERELAVILDKEFANPVGYWSTDQIPISQGVIVRRGFIAEVRGPLAALVGDCGEEYETPDGEASWRIPPAVLPAIAQAHPLEWVRATDAIHEDGRFPGGHRIDREQFPQELWLNLISWAALSFKGIVPPHANAITGTREELEELLSHALIAWARKEQT